LRGRVRGVTNWRQIGWCDKCEWTLDNDLPNNQDGYVCDECGFDSRCAREDRAVEQGAQVDAYGSNARHSTEDVPGRCVVVASVRTTRHGRGSVETDAVVLDCPIHNAEPRLMSDGRSAPWYFDRGELRFVER